MQSAQVYVKLAELSLALLVHVRLSLLNYECFAISPTRHFAC